MSARGWKLLGIGLASAAGLAAAPFLGILSISEALSGEVFWQLRVPRAALSFLAGTGLALAGLAFQAMFRNALATPFTLGVSSGAAFGATVSLRLGWVFSIVGIPAPSLCAFVGGLVSLVLVYGIAMSRRTFSTAVLLLAGVAVSFFFSSLVMFVQYLSDFSGSFRILRWLMGGLETVGYGAVLDVLPFVLSGSAVILCFARELNLLAVVRAVLFTASTLMVGGIVAICGPIGFVGMMAPHICRLLIGAEHRLLGPATALFGGLFLLACDGAGRLLIAPAEIPVGVLTALLGGPFFVWLLVRRRAGAGVLG
jgi:iron complex transport system permease protein